MTGTTTSSTAPPRRCAGRRRRTSPRCREHRYEHGVELDGAGVVSVVVLRPRCLVVVPTVTGYGTA